MPRAATPPEVLKLKRQAKDLSLALKAAPSESVSLRMSLLEVLERLAVLEPENAQLLSRQARILLQLGQTERAKKIVSDLIARWPQSPMGYETAFLLSHATGASCERLEEIVEQAIQNSESAPKFSSDVLQALDAVLERNNALLPRLTAKWPDKFPSHVEDRARMIVSLTKMTRRQQRQLSSRRALVKDNAESRALVNSLERLVAMDPEQPDHQARLALLLAQMGQSDRAHDMVRHLVETWPTNPISYTTSFSVAMNTNAPAAQAAQIIKAAVAHSSGVPKFEKFFVQHLELPKEETAQLIDLLCRTWPDEYAGKFGVGRPAHKAVDRIAILAMQDRRRAKTEAENLLTPHSDGRSSTGKNLLPGLVDAMPAADELLRPMIEDDGSEVIVSAPGSTGTTVLFFAGGAHRLGVSSEVIDAFCAHHGASAIYCRDFSNNTFFAGIPSLGPTRADTTAFLAAKLEELGTRRLVVLTSSGGCLGGVACSLPLNPARAVLVVPMTELSVERLRKAGFPPATIALAERFISVAPPELLDLQRQLGSHAAHIDVAISYGAECVADADQAERMRDTPGVTLMPVPDCNTHGTMTQLISSGDLERLLFT